MSITQSLWYVPHLDEIKGYVDDGTSKRNLIANNVVVFLLKGITKKWKQVIAYYYVSNNLCADDLKNIIFHIISECTKIGLQVKTVICDGEVQHQKLCKSLVDEEGRFSLGDGNKPIYWMFDIPHLLKNLRNCFKKYWIQVSS